MCRVVLNNTCLGNLLRVMMVPRADAGASFGT